MLQTSFLFFPPCFIFTNCSEESGLFDKGLKPLLTYLSGLYGHAIDFRFAFNPLPDIPILGSSNSVANKDLMSKI